VCDADVLGEIERIWAREVAQAGTIKNGKTEWFALRPRGEKDPPPALKCTTLPRRIFRHPRLTTDALHTPIPPLLSHLFEKYTPSPNSHRGYPLARAVLHGDTHLVRFLRRHGADPAEKAFLAVEIALMRKDLGILRILIDGPEDDPAPSSTVVNAINAHGGKRKRTSDDGRPGSSKRARTSAAPRKRSTVVPVRLPQPVVDAALAKGSREIVEYIVHEKGELPFPQSEQKGVELIKR
jgi:hypothetical protein